MLGYLKDRSLTNSPKILSENRKKRLKNSPKNIYSFNNPNSKSFNFVNLQNLDRKLTKNLYKKNKHDKKPNFIMSIKKNLSEKESFVDSYKQSKLFNKMSNLQITHDRKIKKDITRRNKILQEKIEIARKNKNKNYWISFLEKEQSLIKSEDLSEFNSFVKNNYPKIFELELNDKRFKILKILLQFFDLNKVGINELDQFKTKFGEYKFLEFLFNQFEDNFDILDLYCLIKDSKTKNNHNLLQNKDKEILKLKHQIDMFRLEIENYKNKINRSEETIKYSFFLIKKTFIQKN